MADLEQQLYEDRALRNAAKRLVKADVGHLKGDMASKGLGKRLVGRARDGAAEIADETAEFAHEHRPQLGAGLVLVGLAMVGWLFRARLADTMDELLHDKGPFERAADQAAETAEQLAEDARSLID